MARPTKVGLDYFPFDVNFSNDIKMSRMNKLFGCQGLMVIIELFCYIYKENGYYVNFDDDLIIVISDKYNLNESFVNDVILKALELKIFNKKMFHEFKILTSEGIQKRFLEATGRRKVNKIFINYDLVNVYNNEVNVDKNPINVDKNPINVDKNPINVDKNRVIATFCAQSKVNKSKVDVVTNVTTIERKENRNECPGQNVDIKFLLDEYLKNGFGQPSALTMEMLHDDFDEFGFEWCRHGMAVAVEKNARRWSYVRGVLKNWAERFDKSAKPWEVEDGERKQNDRTHGTTTADTQKEDFGNMPTDRW